MIDQLDSVLSHIDVDELVELASQLVRIPSPTEGEAPLADFIAALFDAEGIGFERQEVSLGRPQIIGRLPGSSGGRSLMLNGHMDNDSITSAWQWNPYEPRVAHNRLWGAGIHNMKSGLAALLMAGVAVQRSGIELVGDLVLACVVGELQGGKGTIHLLEQGILTDFAIVPEPYSTSRIITKAAGVHKCSITTFGRSVHTSQSEQGVDAILLMRKVLSALDSRFRLPFLSDEFPDLPKLLVASIIGGRGSDYDLAGPSNLSDICTCIIDIRYPPGGSSDDIDREFRTFLEELESEIDDLRWSYDHPPDPRFRVGGADMPPTDVPVDSRIVSIVARLHQQVTGQEIIERGVVLPYSYCGNDTAHLERAGVECCLYGPRGYVDDVEMHVRVDEMYDCARVLAAAAVEICG